MFFQLGQSKIKKFVIAIYDPDYDQPDRNL